MNNYKKALLGLSGVSAVANTFVAVKATNSQQRAKAIGALVGLAVNTWLVWNA